MQDGANLSEVTRTNIYKWNVRNFTLEAETIYRMIEAVARIIFLGFCNHHMNPYTQYKPTKPLYMD